MVCSVVCCGVLWCVVYGMYSEYDIVRLDIVVGHCTLWYAMTRCFMMCCGVVCCSVLCCAMVVVAVEMVVVVVVARTIGSRPLLSKAYTDLRACLL